MYWHKGATVMDQGFISCIDNHFADYQNSPTSESHHPNPKSGDVVKPQASFCANAANDNFFLEASKWKITALSGWTRDISLPHPPPLEIVFHKNKKQSKAAI